MPETDPLETAIVQATDAYDAALEQAGFIYKNGPSGFEIECREDGDGGWEIVIEIGHHHAGPDGGRDRELVLAYRSDADDWTFVTTDAHSRQDTGEARELGTGLPAASDVIAHIRTHTFCTRTECLDAF